MPPKPVCPAALAEAVAAVLRAFPCAYAGDNSRAALSPRGSGARGVLPFRGEVPHGVRHPRRESVPVTAAETFFRRILSLLGAAAVALPPTPLARRTRPHLDRHPNPTATHLPAPARASTRARRRTRDWRSWRRWRRRRSWWC
jgi:hypothetical protein